MRACVRECVCICVCNVNRFNRVTDVLFELILYITHAPPSPNHHRSCRQNLLVRASPSHYITVDSLESPFTSNEIHCHDAHIEIVQTTNDSWLYRRCTIEMGENVYEVASIALILLMRWRCCWVASWFYVVLLGYWRCLVASLLKSDESQIANRESLSSWPPSLASFLNAQLTSSLLGEQTKRFYTWWKIRSICSICIVYHSYTAI